MEKKTAIVVIKNIHFDTIKILMKDNAERIKWFGQLVDNNATIHDHDLVRVYNTVEEFCNEYNAESEQGYGYSLVAINYTEKIDGKFVDTPYPIYDLSMRLSVGVMSSYQHDKYVYRIVKEIKEQSARRFGDIQCLVSGYWNAKNDYRLHVYLLGDKCRILNNLHDFILDVNDGLGVSYVEGEWSVDGNKLSAIKYDGDEDEYNEETKHPAEGMPIVPEPKPIKVENPKVVDTDTLAPQMDIKEDEEKPKYGNDFLEHIASIWEDGQRTILVDVSGMKFVINGLFDNQDVIIDVYVADTMQRIDRYIEVGATDGCLAEAEYYAEHFAKKIVKDCVVTDSWYLTEKQFKFLKDA